MNDSSTTGRRPLPSWLRRAAVATAAAGCLAVVPTSGAGASNNSNGACNWTGTSSPGAGTSSAFDSFPDDCYLVQARVRYYANFEYYWQYGAQDGTYSLAQAAGFLSGSTRGYSAQAGYGWSLWKAN